MLILTRTPGESIRIDTHWLLTVHHVSAQGMLWSISCVDRFGQVASKLGKTRSSRLGERVELMELVSMRVLSSKGNQVKIGVDAPREMTVHREEIQQRIA